MKRLLIFVFLACATALAQDQPKPPERTQKLVTLRYADPGTVNRLLQRFPVGINISPGSRTMALSGTPAEIAAAEEAIKQLDVQPKNVELTVYFLAASETISPNPPASVPSEVEDVVAQLKKTFPYKNYGMLDALTLRTRSGVEAETSGMLRSSAASPKLTQFRIRAANVSEDGATVRIDGLRAGLRNPTPGQGGSITYVDTGLSTDVDIKIGQKVVVGKSSLAGPESALFLVLTAKVIQ